jgi:hypothetical protein
MKDMELVTGLLLLIEEGARSYSQDQLDEAYSKRDVDWAAREETAKGFTDTIIAIRDILKCINQITTENQTDFYSLVGGIYNLIASTQLPAPDESSVRLKEFLSLVDDEEKRETNSSASAYYAASRSASNDHGPRLTRITIIKETPSISSAAKSDFRESRCGNRFV